MSDFLDLANLGGGPPRCPLCPCDGQTAVEPLLPASLSPGGCPFPPPSIRETLLNYSATAVRFFLGDREPTPDTIASANDYYHAIASAKSFTIVPDTAHTIESTQAGVDAFMAAVRAALK